MLRPLRLVPDGTQIKFMRGRFAGLIVSAVLSIASVIMFFYPGLNYSVDFTGGVVVEVRLAAAADLGTVRSAFGELGLGQVKLQQVGSGGRDLLVTLGHGASGPNTNKAVSALLATGFPGSEIRRFDEVGARVSGELFRSGLLAISLSLVAVLAYIWFRFDWQFGVGVVGTLLLDITKTVGFFAVTRIQFDLNSVAAIMLLIGYSVTD